jgi:hypothetical protein
VRGLVVRLSGALRALMTRLGSAWLVEDDGWYANVTWANVSRSLGVHGARSFFGRGATRGTESDFPASPSIRRWVEPSGDVPER